jgi:uncharacterized repeat protein (TIGR01451 family)
MASVAPRVLGSTLVAGFLVLLPALAQAKEAPPLLPSPPPAPVLGLKIIAPPGAKATFFPDGRVVPLEVPAQVGVRPGYIYRFRLSDLPQGKDLAIYPTIEVIGALHLPHPLCCPNFPVPVVITEEDIERVLSGVFITKLIALEHPDRAVPVATKADEPLENPISPEKCLIEEAWEIGRPMLVVRLGDTQTSVEELQAHAIPGTMLVPGDGGLGPPARPACIPYKCYQITDPLHGLRYPEEECLKDGGDAPPKAGFGPDGKLGGLDPKDTIAEYVDGCGVRRLAISNRVCVCVPRYVVLRTEVQPSSYERMIGPNHAKLPQPPLLVEARVPSLVKEQVEGPEVLKNRERPQVMQEAIGPVIFEQWLSTALIIGEIGPKVVVGTSRKQCPLPCPPLLLCKSVDTTCANIGDVVTFTLRYTNPGPTPISNVVVNDSLTGRLEYVPGSAKSDRDATFTTQENEAGSVILRWETSGRLLPGQVGVITFQAKIR